MAQVSEQLHARVHKIIDNPTNPQDPIVKFEVQPYGLGNGTWFKVTELKEMGINNPEELVKGTEFNYTPSVERGRLSQ